MKLGKKLPGSMLALLLVLPAASGHASDTQGKYYWNFGKLRESIQTADHYMFQPDGMAPTVAPGATMLTREYRAGRITAHIMSAALEPSHAYSIWWVIFNNPQFCATPYECGSGDLGNDRVKPSVFWGGGLLADSDGYGSIDIEITRGKVSRELFGPMKDYGLRNIWNAEVHVVLRTHGEAGVAGTVAEQIGTANEACPPDGCANKFFSIHRSRTAAN